MNKQIQMKSKMSFEEMAEAFTNENPYYSPNRRNVGTYAKQHGYVLKKQMVNCKFISFYLKNK